MRGSRGGERNLRSPDPLDNSDFLNFHITFTKNRYMESPSPVIQNLPSDPTGKNSGSAHVYLGSVYNSVSLPMKYLSDLH